MFLFLANFLTPEPASTVAPQIDWLLYFIIWVSVIFTVGIFVGCVWLAVRFRHRPGINDMGSGPSHSNVLEITWSVIPLILVLLMAIWGFQSYMNISVLPPAGNGTLEIQVTGFKWGWQFTSPNGHTEPQLHVPVNTNVRLVLTSLDVIHSLYFRNFRVKKDVVPGRFNKFWFNATEISPMGKDLSRKKPDGSGYEDLSWSEPSSFEVDQALLEKNDPQTLEKAKSGFDIFCAEYCGNGHSRMLSKVFVHPDEDSYNRWLAAVSDPYRDNAAAVDVGLKLAKNNACFTCHSIDGSAGTGPTWKNMWGNPVKFTDGTGIPAVDEEYVYDSILYPQKQIVQGFGGAMPSFLGKINQRDAIAIMAYMKSISDAYKGPKEELKVVLPKPKEGQSLKDYVNGLGNAPSTAPAPAPNPNIKSEAQPYNPAGAPQSQGQGRNDAGAIKPGPGQNQRRSPNNAAGAGEDVKKN